MLSLNGNEWRIKKSEEVSGDNEAESLINADIYGWVHAKVPGNIQSDLEANHACGTKKARYCQNDCTYSGKKVSTPLSEACFAKMAKSLLARPTCASCHASLLKEAIRTSCG